MQKPLVSINIVVWNVTKWGLKYLRPCFESIKKQTYSNFEIVIVDNSSSDDTVEKIQLILKEMSLNAKIIRHSSNPGLWMGQEIAFDYSRGYYVLALSLDTVMDSKFIENAVNIFESDQTIGAIQGKIYLYESIDQNEKKIDTLGFQISRSRRITNRAHGLIDNGQYETRKQIVAVEGAVPFFRRSSLNSIRINGHFADPLFFWYSDDLDMGWRMTLFGINQIYEPSVIAYHDRQTTKNQAQNLSQHLSRISIRKKIPLKKRRLDWSNNRFTIIKNEYIVNIIRDFPWFFVRELAVFFYTLFIEPGVFLEYPRFFKLIPQMIRQRKIIMKKAKSKPNYIHSFYVR